MISEPKNLISNKGSECCKFSRPFHGPYRVVEVLETGVLVSPVDNPENKAIRVALHRVRRCPKALPEGEFWPPKKTARKQKPAAASVSTADPEGVWRGQLRKTREAKRRPPEEQGYVILVLTHLSQNNVCGFFVSLIDYGFTIKVSYFIRMISCCKIQKSLAKKRRQQAITTTYDP